jgi:hypothetical protein
MPTLRITIKMDNAAFGDAASSEAARILRGYATYLDGLSMFDSYGTFKLHDLNGNTVGEAKVAR